MTTEILVSLSSEVFLVSLAPEVSPDPEFDTELAASLHAQLREEDAQGKPRVVGFVGDQKSLNEIEIQDISLVVLIGPTGSGKSTFAAKHFSPENVLSSDDMRRLVRSSEFDRSKEASQDAFDVLHFVLDKRLSAGLFTVVDATNISYESRKPLLELARKHYVQAVAVVLALDTATCAKRNVGRRGKEDSGRAALKHNQILWKGLGGKTGERLRKEGFAHVRVFQDQNEIDQACFKRVRMPSDFTSRHEGFDVIGDVCGCHAELVTLLTALGYAAGTFRHPEGRSVVFTGNLVGHGPEPLEVLALVLDMYAAGCALLTQGEQDAQLASALAGRRCTDGRGVEHALAQFNEVENWPDSWKGQDAQGVRKAIQEFLYNRPHHVVLDGGKLVVSFGGLPAEMHNRDTWDVRKFARTSANHPDTFFREMPTTWEDQYQGRATVVYGSTAIREPKWVHRTVNVNTGVQFGGRLTALRWPACEFVSVAAKQVWRTPLLPAEPEPEAQGKNDVLVLPDVENGIEIDTRLLARVKVPPENLIQAIETVSRQAVHPRWLIYVPPTMSPCEVCEDPERLEHPRDALAYYRKHKVQQVVCEEKHMGSRAVVIVGKDEDAIQNRFGFKEPGVIYTRTGRRFFRDQERERSVLGKIRDAITSAGLWSELDADWLCLDCEILPWSAKAGDLLRMQYAVTGWAGKAALGGADALLQNASKGRPELAALAERTQTRLDAVNRYDATWRNYCWQVEDESGLQVAPFHVLAGGDKVFTTQTNEWHMQMCDQIVAADESNCLRQTWWRVVGIEDEQAISEVCAEWERRTQDGEEGMVFKPLDFVVHGGRGLVQPAVKVRGAKYLRIIYGPEYLLPEHLKRLRKRSVGGKRSLADKEFALSVEGLERFARGESLARVHECALGVLAFEAESVDPRL